MESESKKIDSKFRYVLLAATRAEQMMLRQRPEVEQEKPCRQGMREISEGLVEWEYGPPPPAEEEEEAATVSA